MVINHVAQAVNYVIMATVVVVSVWFVGHDARRRGFAGQQRPAGQRFQFSLFPSASASIS